jgi:hypothetical protein
MSAPDLDQDANDPQDAAERADETHLNEDEDEFTTLEDAPGAFDALETVGDDDEEDALALDADELGDPRTLDDEQVDDRELDDAEPDAYEPEVEWAEAAGDDGADAVEDALGGDEIEGLDTVAHAESVEGGEDDFTNFQSKRLSDDDLAALGYAGRRGAKP